MTCFYFDFIYYSAAGILSMTYDSLSTQIILKQEPQTFEKYNYNKENTARNIYPIYNTLTNA